MFNFNFSWNRRNNDLQCSLPLTSTDSAGVLRYIKLPAGQKVAAILAAGTDTLFITELD